MKSFVKLFSALLLICLMLCIIACGQKEPAATTTATTTTTTSAQVTTAPVTTQPTPIVTEPVSFKLTSDFIIVRPETSSQTELAAAKLLATGIESAYGFECRRISDLPRGSEIVPNEFEILIGKTNRTESKEFFNDLAYYDYGYKIVSENVIAICGGSPDATYTAVQAFLKEVLGYEENADTEEVISPGSAATLTTGDPNVVRAQYPTKTIKIGTRDLFEYTLVVTDESLEGIDVLLGGFSRLCGKKIPIVHINDKDSISGPAIYFGCHNENGKHYSSSIYGTTRFFITESGENFFIDFKSEKTSVVAAERFINEYLPHEPTENVTVEFKGSESVLTGVRVSSGTNGLDIYSTTSQQLAEGVYYTEQVYLDQNGAPVRTYAITVKKGAANIITSLPEGGLGSLASVKTMLIAEREAGKNAIASFNADFYDLGGTNIMKGLCIKDGVELHPAGTDEFFGKTWFGITKDGNAVIANASQYSSYKGNLETAVGASNILLKKDTLVDLGGGTEFGDTRHPRTAIGITPDGDVVIIVIDGRQPSISNGASLADTAFIISTFGCCEAVNLDGGGSSGLVISDSNGNITTMNSPSDGRLRSVANGLTIVLP